MPGKRKIHGSTTGSSKRILNQKETDYELLVQINGSQDISRKISKNLETILGLPVKDEKEYKKTLKKIEDQIKN